MTKTELTKTLKAIIAREREYIQSCQGNTNPQVREMVLQSRERAEFAEAVIDALNGDRVAINIYLGI